MTDLSALKNELITLVEAANDLITLDEARVTALGKKGRITQQMKNLGGMDPETRKQTGQALNAIKTELADLIEERQTRLNASALESRLAQETLDVTLPVRQERTGRIHPITQTMDDIISIFADMGFTMEEGPDIEDDFHNFTALNFPPKHPAREMHDTFYLPDAPLPEEGCPKGFEADFARRLLRTHTSTCQIRAMQDKGVPIRAIVMGRTYRSDYDITHTPMFHQLEGLVIDKKTHMGHLKGCLIEFCRAYFGVDELPVRFRPSFFPFTEPSAEMDIGCSRADGGLKIGAGDDWLEILGCGMVHPNVLSNCGIDPNEYQGFAFGMGVERVAMLKYGIPDLRSFFESDTRWLSHYGFDALDIPNRATGERS